MKYTLICLYLVLSVVLLGSCASIAPKHAAPPGNVTQPPQKKISHIDVLHLPVTYKGTISCEGYREIRCHLNLMPDGSFMLKRTYVSTEPGRKDQQVADSGTWHVEDNGRILVLTLHETVLYRFAACMDGCICLSGNTGPQKPAGGNLLCSLSAFEPVAATGVMRGLYSYMAGVGLFRDCDTGIRYRVAMEGDHAALEQAYTSAEHGVAEPLLVRFEGHVTSRPAMGGGKMDRIVVVEHFITITSARSCNRTPVHTGRIENIKWRLVEISGQQAVTPDGMPLPGFRLNSQGRSLRGFAGCNRMMGTYRLKGSELRFESIATTRRFCENTQALEDRFLQALEQVRRYTLKDGILELYGDYGLLARLKSSGKQD